MDSRTEKLALARQKLKDHQEKKSFGKDTNVGQSVQIDVPENKLPDNGNPLYLDVISEKNKTSESDFNQSINFSIDEKELINKLSLPDGQKKKEEYLFVSTKPEVHNVQPEEKNALNALIEEKASLNDQLELQKNVINSKNAQILSLKEEIKFLQEQNDAFQLRLDQLTNGSADNSLSIDHSLKETNINKEKSLLEEKLQNLQKERDQLAVHYEHYVAELNDQLQSTVSNNNKLSNEIHNLSLREASLVDQLSEMEIRLQDLKVKEHETSEDKNYLNELQNKHSEMETKIKDLQKQYEDAIQKLTETENKLQYLSESKPDEDMQNSSISKLSADIASDKIAAQKATEQNVKLKMDLQDLEKAFVKMSKDKLELTEKLTAEKYLNRELTIKLAEIEDKLKVTQNALSSKDKEMIRLLNNYTELEKKIAVGITEHISDTSREEDLQNSISEANSELEQNKFENDNSNNELICKETVVHGDTTLIPKDAMFKLQERFLKIMDDVANLSDEKQQLEHLVTQLQNETDTICEYVALYQQQRSLLKKRDEERSAQINAFHTECTVLRNQLAELGEIILELSKDQHMGSYFQTEPRRTKIINLLSLLGNLRDNIILNSETCAQLGNFYPCSCCSGKLIEV